jgi:hypothetical protein
VIVSRLPTMDATTTTVSPRANRKPSLNTYRSAVSNGRRLHAVRPGDTIWARRFKDILGALVSDAGGADNMSEARMQLCRRAASICVEAEKLEIRIAGGPPSLEQALTHVANGIKPLDIINEAARIIHACARSKGGDSIQQIIGKPREQLDYIVSLLEKAATIANMAASYGEVNLELYGMLCDRLNRCLPTLGLERLPRDITGPRWNGTQQAGSPLRADLAVDDAEPPVIDAEPTP